ncbi:MAG: HAMP domain-containing sensor histidine kinase [Victivallaceae bacterium]|nr:HAMP domain-containing sensor histidine kinase [Victivallaceae bacterium]
MILRSLRTKVALGYFLLYIVSCSAIYAAVIWVVRFQLSAAADAENRRLAAELLNTALLPPRMERFGTMISAGDAPAEELAKIRAQLSKFRLCYVFASNGPTRKYYTFFGFQNGRFLAARVERSGSIHSRELHLEGNHNNILSAIRSKIDQVGTGNLSIRHLTASPVRARKPGPRFFVRDSGKLRGFCFLLPDGSGFELLRNFEPVNQRLKDYSLLFAAVTLAIGIFGCAAGWLLAASFTGSIRKVGLVMDEIASGDYRCRVSLSRCEVEIQELADRFNRMNAKTESLLEELRMVSDNIAHELRTPLTRMKGMLEIALTSRDTNAVDYHQVCGDVALECEKMKELIGEMLEITRVNSMQEILRPSAVDLVDFLSDLFDLMEPLAEEKAIDFTLSLPEDHAHCVIAADLGKLQRVIGNLLGNAFKYTPEGGAVRMFLKHTGKEARIGVQDTGCGIEPAEIPEIFTRFRRGSRTRGISGNGLGLALVKAIVEAHKWRIQVESTPGKGSLFTVVIPLDPAPAA